MSEKDQQTKENGKPKDDSKSNDQRVIEVMLAGRKTVTVDSETLIKETQKRIWASLKTGIEYQDMFEKSDKFLREHAFDRLQIFVLFVDLVGSTDLTLELPAKKVASIISSFSQEMAFVVKHHRGYVLKFVGDAVVGYFIPGNSPLLIADYVVNSAIRMREVVEKGINPILNEYDYPELSIKIGIDYGESVVVQYGKSKAKSHVDLLGPALSIAAKIQNLAKPNQILVGDDVFTKLHPSLKKLFTEKHWHGNEWRYHDRETGKLYPVFEIVD